MAKETIVLVGSLPPEAHSDISEYLGEYTKWLHHTNGKPCYEKVGDTDKMIWAVAHGNGPVWCFGHREDLGTDVGCAYNPDGGVSKPELVTKCWKVMDKELSFVDAPLAVYVQPSAPAAEASEVEVTGGRSREEKDTDLRKRAIDLDADTPRKRSRNQEAQLEERVAKARSTTDIAIEKKAKEVAQPAFNDYMSDKIDEAELKHRKVEARLRATVEHKQRHALDKAYDAFLSAGRSRQRAWTTYKYHLDSEDKFEVAVNTVLATLEPGPSGAVKAEA
tara:strand:+ start:268 stop:1098 length:831 start_codon:yes stop_codon:yes gene_type:complete